MRFIAVAAFVLCCFAPATISAQQEETLADIRQQLSIQTAHRVHWYSPHFVCSFSSSMCTPACFTLNLLILILKIGSGLVLQPQ